MPDHDGHKHSHNAGRRRRSSRRRTPAERPFRSADASDADSPAPHQDLRPPLHQKEQLAAQAQATAEQALQLARLAEESARLAQRLNHQALSLGNGQHSSEQNDIASGPIVNAGGRVDAGVPISSPVSSSSLFAVVDTARITASPRPRSRRGRRRAAKPRSRKRRVQTIGRRFKSVAVSTALHLLILFLLGLVTWTATSEEAIHTVIASFADEPAIVEEALPVEVPLEEPGEQQEVPTPEEPPPEEPEASDDPNENVPQDQPPAPAEAGKDADDAPLTPGPEPAAAAVDLVKVGSRSEEGKALLLEKYGGTAASESAVQHALEWFSSRQRPDGSWNFTDVGPCSHPGNVDNPMGATAYVLLCYLGAGQTHLQGKFKNNVRAGLTFLLRNGRRVPAGGDFRGADCREHDNFYVQAPVATVLSEAYRMTNDRHLGLRQAAQLAVDFLCHAQDPEGGGWRYEPHEPGCTSVTVLVAMALKSAVDAGLSVPPQVLPRISHYLDTVRSDDSPTGRYGYRVREPNYRASTTAMALLCRMYLGWKRDHEELQNGVALLDKRGPYDNLYYCYYATQLMRHWGGKEWQRWNSIMRDDLVQTQVQREGPEFGSWAPRDRSGPSMAGGRLFITCLATMTLEVYYRYLPLYGLPGDDDALAEQDPKAAVEIEVN